MKRFKKLLAVLIVSILGVSLIGCNAKDTDNPNKDLGQVEDENIEDEEVEDNDEESLDEESNSIDSIIDSSDYISKIKLIEKGKDNLEIKILDNIKDPLNSADLPAIDNLEVNRAYIVFMKNLDNEVVLTDKENGIILLEGDNHELFEKINKKHNN